jgi:type VI secretion system protein VasJ
MVSEIPPAGDDGKTNLPAPRAQVGNALRQLLQTNNWTGLLEASENAFQDTTGTFWLDLQRMTYRALQGLGSNYERASLAVIKEMASFIDRFPNIVELSFKDGTPFADDETKDWITTQVISLHQDNDLQSLSIDDGEDSTLSEDLQKAFELISRKDLKGALEILQEGMDSDFSYRRRFIRRLTAGKYCLQLGQPLWAKALLEKLNEEIEKVSLQEWDPKICIQIWKALYQCYKRLLSSKKIKQKDSLEERMEELRSKLFQHNIKSAIAIETMDS